MDKTTLLLLIYAVMFGLGIVGCVIYVAWKGKPGGRDGFTPSSKPASKQDLIDEAEFQLYDRLYEAKRLKRLDTLRRRVEAEEAQVSALARIPGTAQRLTTENGQLPLELPADPEVQKLALRLEDAKRQEAALKFRHFVENAERKADGL